MSFLRVHRVILASGSRFFLKAFRTYDVKTLPKINLPLPNVQPGEGHSDDQFSRILKYFYNNQDFYSIRNELTDQNIWEFYA